MEIPAGKIIIYIYLFLELLKADNIKFLLEAQAKLGKKGMGSGFYRKDPLEKAKKKLKLQEKKLKKLKLKEDLVY